MSYLGTGVTQGTVELDSFTGNGSTTDFTLTGAPVGVDGLLVSLDGVVQDPGEWSLSGTTLSFSTAPHSSGDIRVWNLAISASAISDDAVTLAKMAGGTDGNIISYDASGDPVAIATGDEGEVLTSAGEGAPPTFAAAAAGGLTSLVADTTPQLGGQLDVNGNAIGDGTLELLKFSETGSAVNELTVTNAATGNPPALSATGGDANINLKLAGKGTGGLEIGATATTASKLILAEDTDNGAHTITVAAPAAVTGDITLTLPDGDGDADQFLQTNGSGVLSWAAAAGGGGGYTEGCRIYTDGDQSIANNTYTDVIFGASPRYDTDNMTDQTNDTTSTKITFTTAGVYVVWGSMRWKWYPGNQGLDIYLNGGTIITRVRNASDAGQIFEIATTVWKFDAADYVTLQAFQESGGALETSNEYGAFAPEFAAQRIG